MSLMDEIKFYIRDEEEANTTYSRMASDADDAGMHQTAKILRGMAADELRHKEMLEGMYYSPEFGPVRESYYWETTNMVIGEIAQSGTKYESLAAAVQHAESILDEDFRHWTGHHLVIKIFNKSPEERADLTYEPVHTKSYWVGETLTPSGKRWFAGPEPVFPEKHRFFPQTYGDWVDLAEDIKTKDPGAAFMVNAALEDIASETAYADRQKRWLVRKAGELNIR